MESIPGPHLKVRARVTSAVLKPILKAIFIVPGSVAELSLFIAGSGSDFGKVLVSVRDSNLEPDLNPNKNFPNFSFLLLEEAKCPRKLVFHFRFFLLF